MGLDFVGSKPQNQSAEKAKRSTGEDARLSLLLQMLDESERQTIKDRLLNDLSADGETLSLADLLAAQESDVSRRHQP